MSEWRMGFTKTVHGYYEVEAGSLKEAKKKFENGDYDQFDNKEDSEDSDKWEEQEGGN